MAYGETYEQFVEKFEKKKTTDDCYTPEKVMIAITDWVINKYGLQNKNIVRPFWPDTDYQEYNYDIENDVVIDNPPFSILSKIVQWYDEKNIKYFLFAPTLTLFSTAAGKCNYVVAGEQIVYENGAVVNSSFVTNLGECKILISTELRTIIKNAREYKNDNPKYTYPDNVINGAIAGTICRYADEDIEIHHAHFTRRLDAQKKFKKTIYGSGFLLSDKDVEKIKPYRHYKTETDYVFSLSVREKEILKGLNNV